MGRCPMSGGVDTERERGLASGSAAAMVPGWASWGNAGWLQDWVGVLGGVDSPEAVDRVKTTWSLSSHVAMTLQVNWCK